MVRTDTRTPKSAILISAAVAAILRRQGLGSRPAVATFTINSHSWVIYSAFHVELLWNLFTKEFP